MEKRVDREYMLHGNGKAFTKNSVYHKLEYVAKAHGFRTRHKCADIDNVSRDASFPSKSHMCNLT